jgi:hypothetical protein
MVIFNSYVKLPEGKELVTAPNTIWLFDIAIEVDGN